MINFRASGFFLSVLSKVFLTGLLLSVWVVQAASLGRLTVSSYLGQPLSAEIALESVTDKEADSLSARLASPEVFQKEGVNLAPYHATLSVSVKKRMDGHPYIHLSSLQALNEPVLNLIIELNSSSGLLLREYNVLLDPVETQKSVLAVPAVRPDAAGVVNSTASAKEALSVKQSASPVQPRNAYGPVIDGDTLSRIARQVSPNSVNLNQMLVALYRANRDAFLEDNMNLLKAGIILRIPDESEVLSVPTREASREVAIQKESWDNYRQKIAALVLDSSGNSELKQSQSGRIATVSEASSIVESNKPEEVLTLSKGELLNDNSSTEKTTDRTAQDYLRMMEEDAIAKEHALQEANERVVMLEKNVAKLERLLDLKESTAAEDGTRVDLNHAPSELDLREILTASEQVDSASAQDTKESHASATEVAKENSTSPLTIPAQPVKPATSFDSPQPIDTEVDEPDSMGTLLQHVSENSQWVAAGLAALLAVALGVSLIRRRKGLSEENSDFYTPYNDAKNDNEAAIQSALVDIEESHGLDEKSLMQQAVNTPEIDNSDSANTNTDHAAIEPGLFFGNKSDNEKAATASFFVPGSSNQMGVENDTTSDVASESDSESNKIDIIKSGQVEHQEEMSIDREEHTTLQEDNKNKQWATTDDNQPEGQSDTLQTIDSSEKYTLPEETELEQETHAADELSKLGAGLADIDLGDKPGVMPQAVSEELTGDAEARQQEIATKLDLAKAYLEMDDSEGARDILEEVLREGNHEQQSIARSMLDNIG
jgi:pilus assembly protein FimV